MTQNPPTIEHHGEGRGRSTSSAATSSSVPTSGGPVLVYRRPDGSERTIRLENLQLYLATLQTILVLYIAFKEVST